MSGSRILQRGLRPMLRNLTGSGDALRWNGKLSTHHHHRLVTLTLTAVQPCRTKASTVEHGRPVNVEKEIEGHIEKLKEKTSDVLKNPCAFQRSHFRANREIPPMVDHFIDPVMVGVEGTQLTHGTEIPPIWSEDEVLKVRVTHKTPTGFVETLALRLVKALKSMVDVSTGFNRKLRTEKMWIDRICFLESIAVVPPMMGAMTRHISSLRKMDSDHGWVKTLLEEAENERMHLVVGMILKQPSKLYRNVVSFTQVSFSLWWLLAYLVSPRFCSHFVAYLEEEAVFTYTKCLWDIEHGQLQHWKTMPAPKIAIEYWHLPEDASMKDIIFHIRADEDHHRIVNHTLGMLKKENIKITPEGGKK